jgi:hypothetical protein
MEPNPVDLFLDGYARGIRAQAERLRKLVKAARPDALERMRTHWRVIGYDVPLGRRTRYFAWISVEPIHVHLGFQYGAWMEDADRVLEGAQLHLRQVRYLTYLPGQSIPRAPVLAMVREAVDVACLSAAERASRAFDLDWRSELDETGR